MRKTSRILTASSCQRVLRSRLTDISDSQNQIVQVGEGKRYAKKELYQRICRFSAVTENAASIVLAAENSVNWIALFFACLLNGKKLYILSPDEKDSYYDMEADKLQPDMLFFGEKPIVVRACRCCPLSDGDMPEHAAASIAMPRNEPTIVLYTTGTTGRSKGVSISLVQLLNNLLDLEEIVAFTPEDRVMLFAPFYRAMGMIVCIWGVLFGGDCILTANQIEFIHAVESERPTVLNFPPVYLGVLKEMPKHLEVLKSANAVIVGSARIADDLYEFYSGIGVRVINGYGMTECVSAIAITNPRTTQAPKYVTPLRSCEIRLSDDSEIWVRGITVSAAYLDKTPITDEDGWFHTGDMGEWHDGLLEVVGRRDHIAVLRNGIKIDLANIKKRILALEGIISCKIYVSEDAYSDILCADMVVRQDVYKTEAELLWVIDAALDSFEKIRKITSVEYC